MSELTAIDIQWFILANSNPQLGFYAFKDRFLRRFATPDGFDKQSITLSCYACDGTGTYNHGTVYAEPCNRCRHGVYDVRTHWLQRWSLHGHIFHKPMDHADVYHLHVYKYPDPVREIEGRIQHQPVDSKVACRSYYRLLLRHEPCTFYLEVMNLVKWKTTAHRAKMYFCLIRLRDRMDLFPANPEIDTDVPF